MKSDTRRLGPYQMIELLGSGGMGDVFKARDTRLDRTVAIKLLKSEHAERFRREAKAISALNHPHICTLYDVGEEGGTDFLVMEYVEGRLLDCPLPQAEALRYAIQIADALIAAHRKGIVHRDLKPGNIMITESGVKLLDFGMAKVQEAPEARDTETSTTITRGGTIVGTLHYMSPEQVSGREVDARSDIFAFGQLFYEMLSGRRGFEGTSQADIIASILRDEPRNLAEIVPGVSPAIERVISKCLRKNPAERWQSMEAVKDALEWAAESAPAAVPVSPNKRRRLWWLAAGLGTCALVLGALLAARLLVSPQPQPRLQVDIALPPQFPTGFDTLLSLSPDGQRILLNSNRSLWVKSLEDGSLTQLRGTTGGSFPFWSPDGKQVGFFADGKLKKLVLSSGSVEVLCDAPNSKGGAWSPSGDIVFSPEALGPLFRIPAGGGQPVQATALDESRQEILHTNPVFLPGGRRFLYLAQCLKTPNDGIAVGSVEGTPAPRVSLLMAGAESGAQYAAPAGGGPGWLLYLRQRNLMAHQFDPAGLSLSGSPILLVKQVRSSGDRAMTGYSLAQNGAILFVRDQTRANRLNWVSREGNIVGTLGEPGEYVAARLSPDSRRIAAVRREEQELGKSIWIIDLERNVDSKVTNRGDADDPVWSPDASRLIYAWHKGGEDQANLFISAPGRPDQPEPLLPAGSIRWPLDWSRDGRSLIYAQIDPVSKFDLWVLPLSKGADPVQVVRTPGKDNEARFSPDGRFIAYQSDQVAETRVYVLALEGGKEQMPVSEGHGAEPRWRDDGKELFYLSGDGALMAVPVLSTNREFKAGRPVRLFGGRNSGFRILHFDPAPGGQRFLALLAAEGGEGTTVHLLLNWQAAAR